MLSVDAVLQVIAREVHPLPPRLLPLELAGGAVLAHDVTLDHDSPPFDRSQLDGYAVRAADVRPAGSLKLVGHIDAGGSLFTGTLGENQCVAINTGGVIPNGADAILMVEQTQRHAGEVIANTALKQGYGIQRRGSDARAGETLLPAGTPLGAAQLAVCAAAGVASPQVRKARVAVLTTGDELLHDLIVPLTPGKIRNSNRPMLLGLAAGCDVQDLGTCPDEAAPLREALLRGLHSADLLIVSGGMSMGTRDLVPPMLKELGVTLHVEKVMIKPGKPFILGTFEKDGTRGYVAGLPGNPVSGFVTFQRFVRVALARMTGTPPPAVQRAQLETDLSPNGDREFYLPCVITPSSEGLPRAKVLKWKGSADLFTLARANGLVIQPADDPGKAAGHTVEVLAF